MAAGHSTQRKRPVTARRLALAMALVAAVSFGASIAGLDVRASYGARTTGDEPYYLITAQSLARDWSLDISDEIASGAFRSYHEIPLDEQTKPLDGGRRVSPHDPLLPLLLAVPFALGGWAGAKAALCVVAGALAALVVWVAVRRFDVPLIGATTAAGVFGASAPFAVYGNQVYPELPAALALLIGVAALAGRRTTGSYLMVALSVVALVWLSVKYAPVALALALIALVRLWRSGGPRAAGSFAGALGVAGVVFALAHLAWYGGLTPYAAGDHFTTGELSVVGLSPNFPGRARRLIGLLIDREFGLIAWQPAWLLAVPAGAALARARPADWAVLAAPAAAGWLNATFIALTMQGWWWPGRQVVVVLPCIVLAVAWWTSDRRGRLAALAATGAVGIVFLGWLVVDGLAGRITWVVDFFETTNPLYRGWRGVLPDYLDVTAMTWVLQSLWLLVCTGLVAWAVRGRATERVEEEKSRPAAAVSAP